MSEKFTTEKDGQIDFYNQFLPRINPTIIVDEIIANNNDGVLNGNLIESKLTVKDLNEVLFQCIKYLSALRIKGTPVPANIVIVDLNSTKAYLYKSENYLDSIEKVYNGGASKNNAGFIGGEPKQILDYSNAKETENLISLLKENNFTKIPQQAKRTELLRSVSYSPNLPDCPAYWLSCKRQKPKNYYRNNK